VPPSDFVGPPAPGQAVAAPGATQFNVPGYEPGTPRAWHPDLPPYAPQQALEEAARVSILQQVGSQDTAQRGVAKAAAGILPTPDETNELIRRAVDIRNKGGLGTVVSVDLPGMKTNVGSPYNVAPITTSEYQTPGEAAAALQPGQVTVPTNRGTFQNVPIPQVPPPATPPAPVTGAPGAGGPTAPPAAVTAPAATAPPPSPPRPAPTVPRPAAPAATPAPAATAAPPPPPVPRQAPPAPPRPAAPPAIAAPSPPPALPPPPPAYVPPGLPQNAPSVPAPRVGYPSPAPAPTEELSAVVSPGGFLAPVRAFFAPAAAAAAEPPPAAAVPDIRPQQRETTIVAPAVPERPPQGGVPAVQVAPGAQEIPLARRTYTGTAGQTDVYEPGQLSELAADAAAAGITDFRTASKEQIADFNQRRQARQQREAVSTEDVHRMLRPSTETERSGTQMLLDAGDNIRKFKEDFPNPEDRDKYIGWATRPIAEGLMYFRDDPKFKLFVDDVAKLQEVDKERARKLLSDPEQRDFAGNVPTGHEMYASQFENRLEDFEFDINKNLAIRLALQQMPVGEQTPQWATMARQYFARIRADQKADRAAAERAATEGGPPSTVVVAPPTTTTTIPPAPAAPPPYTVIFDRPAE